MPQCRLGMFALLLSGYLLTSCSLPQKCHIMLLSYQMIFLQVVHTLSLFTVLLVNFSDCNGFHDPAVVLVTLGPDNCDTFPLHGFVFPRGLIWLTSGFPVWLFLLQLLCTSQIFKSHIFSGVFFPRAEGPSCSHMVPHTWDVVLLKLSDSRGHTIS